MRRAIACDDMRLTPGVARLLGALGDPLALRDRRLLLHRLQSASRATGTLDWCQRVVSLGMERAMALNTARDKAGL